MKALNIRTFVDAKTMPENTNYKYVLASDIQEYLGVNGFCATARPIKELDGSLIEKNIIAGEYLDIAFHCRDFVDISGTQYSQVICEIVFKNGRIALPNNTFVIELWNLSSADLANSIDAFILVNKAKLSEEYIHFCKQTTEFYERMTNSGEYTPKHVEFDASITEEEEY